MRGLRVADNLVLPVQAIAETFGILAAKGAGKSNAAAVMAEEMFRLGLPFVVIDPARAWYGLRSSRDGKPGLPIPIFGGKHGDIPLERGAGVLIADLVVDQRLSCILDITEFESESAKKQFLLDFAQRLFKRNEHPLHLFLEEADDYLPQKPMRDEAQLLRAWENIVRRGRNRGIGITMITQRSASINKSVLTQVQTLIALRTTGPQDRAAIEAWLKYQNQSEEIMEDLPSLRDGEAWVWSPVFLKKTVKVKFHQRKTFDSGATPKISDAKKAPATLADVDLGNLKKRMAATIEKAKLEDPRELQRELKIARAELAEAKVACGDYLKPHDNLKGAIKNLRQVAMTAKELVQLKGQRGKRVEVPILKAAQVKRFEATVCRWEKINEKTLKALGAMVTVAGEARDSLRKASAVKASALSLVGVGVPGDTYYPRGAWSSSTRIPSRVARSELVREQQRRGTGKVSAVMVSRRSVEGTLTGPERKILTALAQHGPRSTAALALLAGYAASGGAFRNPLSALRSKGYVANYGPGVTATPDGLDALGTWDPLPAGAALLEWWLGHLSGPESKLLRAAAAKSPITPEALAEATGYEVGGGAFRNPLSRLRTLGLVSGRGEIRVAEELVQ